MFTFSCHYFFLNYWSVQLHMYPFNLFPIQFTTIRSTSHTRYYLFSGSRIVSRICFFYHELPSTLYNQNLYRADKLHLTTKGNDILVRWLHHCITRLTQPTQNQTHPLPSLQDLPSPLVITDTDWPPLPTRPITTLQTNYIVSIQIQQTKPN